MSYSVRLTREAARELARLPERQRARMLERVRRLADWPAHGLDTRPLRGELAGLYRLRSGAYRALFTVRDAERVIVVERVRPRESIYG